MNGRMLEATRLWREGFNYDEIARELDYADRTGARRAVKAVVLREIEESNDTIFGDDIINTIIQEESIVSGNTCPRCQKRTLIRQPWEGVSCIQCTWRPGEVTVRERP